MKFIIFKFVKFYSSKLMKTIKLAKLQFRDDQTKLQSTLDSFLKLKKRHVNWQKPSFIQPNHYSALQPKTKDKLQVNGISQSQRIVLQSNASLQISQQSQKQKSPLLQQKERNPQIESQHQNSSLLPSQAGRRIKTLSLSNDLRRYKRTSIKHSSITSNGRKQAGLQWLNKSRQFKPDKGKGYKLLELIGRSYIGKNINKKGLNLSDISIKH